MPIDLQSAMEITYEIACQVSDKVSVDKKVLELLSATKGFAKINDGIASSKRLSAKQFLLIGKHLGLSEASVRMALSRQTKNGKLERSSGLYSLVNQNQPFLLPRFWLDIESRVTKWQGDWFLVSLAGHRVNATQTRNLTKKATFLGLAKIDGLGWVRPNNLTNLKHEVSHHFEQVLENKNFLTSNLLELDAEWQSSMHARWPVNRLNQFYIQTTKTLVDERLRLSKASKDEIVHRSFTFGRLLIERLSHDPWLPSQMIDLQSRQNLIDESKAYYLQIMPAWFDLMNVR